MAGKEHQGLQIALILFVLITIALGVTSFIFYKEWENQVGVAESAQRLAAEEERIRQASDRELERLKIAVGKTPQDEVPAIEREIEELMKKYAATYPDPAATIITALENQMDTYLQLQAATIKHQDQLASLEDDKRKLQEELAAVNRRFEEDKNAQLALLMEARRQFEEDKRTFVTTAGAKDEQLAGAMQRINQSEAERARERNELANQLRDLKRNHDSLRDQLTGIKDTDVASPDGRITAVSERQRMVWINIGSADGLRRQTSFSVFDRDISQINQDTPPKAKIEVVRLLDNHVAEARIVEDNLRDPILPTHVIFSTVFTPGQVEHFAVAGKIDIDGSGTDDLERLRSIISINGGVIDALVDHQGKRSGRPTVNTRFLIVGEPPAAREDNAEALRNYAQLLREAENAGVKQISVSKFLDYVGYAGRERSVGLGRRADPDDFRPRSPAAGGGSTFQRRTP